LQLLLTVARRQRWRAPSLLLLLLVLLLLLLLRVLKKQPVPRWPHLWTVGQWFRVAA
jgi:hypothetical protein